MLREAEQVSRPGLGVVYKQHMVKFLTTHGLTIAEAELVVNKAIATKFVDKTIHSIDTVDGDLRLGTNKLSEFVKGVSDAIVTPSGSFYEPHYKKISLISEFASDGLVKRNTLKTLQFEAKAAGDTDAVNQYMFAQTSVKINLNSLPGGFGSPYNIFYDKGGYNSITSVARALIAHAYTTCELCLGGNPAIFDVEELTNWIIIVIGKMPSREQIQATTRKYGIREATRDDLLAYYTETLSWYCPSVDMTPIRHLIARLEDHQVHYLYYMGNLPHLLFHNDSIMRPVISRILSHDSVDTSGIAPEEFYKLDGDALAIASTIRADELVGINVKKIVDVHPEEAKLLVATTRRVESELATLSELFETFMYTQVSTQKILTRKHMKRHTVVVSDTDSIIFTSKNWLQWYVGHLDGVGQKAYDIASLATYFITKVNEDSMAKFAIDCGATGKYVRQMKMKNEFLYPVLIIFDIKKTYAGMVKVQEGVILPEGELDLKGGALRSSDIPPASLKFTKDLMVDHILKPAESGRLKASKLIGLVLDYENHIRESIGRLETQFVNRQSVNTIESYKAPDSSCYAYAYAWNKIFSEKYGVFHPPDKVAVLKLLTPTPAYFDYVKSKDPKIYQAMMQLIEEKGKLPIKIVIPNSASGIPEELSPIVNVREIIYSNIKPTYLTLGQLGIYVGYKKEFALFSDTYLK